VKYNPPEGRLRCSSLPRLIECPASGAELVRRYMSGGPYASLGNAYHGALGYHVVGAEPDLDSIALYYKVELDQLRAMYLQGVKAWAKLKKYFPEAWAEQPLESDSLVGHADVLSLTASGVSILDWKGARGGLSCRAQLGGYTHCASHMFGPFKGRAMTVAVYLRTGEIDVTYWGATELEELASEIATAGNQTDTYGPGPACEYCPRQVGCDARDDWLRSSAVALRDGPGALAPADLAALYPRAVALEKALGAYRAALREAVRVHGAQPIGDGRELCITEEEHTSIATAHGVAALSEELEIPMGQIVGELTLPKSTITRLVKEVVKKGAGAATIRRVYQEIGRRGGLTKRTSAKMAARKIRDA